MMNGKFQSPPRGGDYRTNSAVIGLCLLLVLTTAVGGIFGFAYIMALPEPEAAKAAAAIQAVGSVVAILIAIAVPAWLHIKSERSKEEDRRIFAAAFGTQLLPHLTALKNDFEYVAENLGSHIKDLQDEKMGVTWDDHSPNFHDHLQYIRDNWTAVAQLDGPTARAVVTAASLYARALDEHIDVEHGTESYEDGEGNGWHTVDFGTLLHARGYLDGVRLALSQVTFAVTRLEASMVGKN